VNVANSIVKSNNISGRCSLQWCCCVWLTIFAKDRGGEGKGN